MGLLLVHVSGMPRDDRHENDFESQNVGPGHPYALNKSLDFSLLPFISMD